jgi:hypothetical protein
MRRRPNQVFPIGVLIGSMALAIPASAQYTGAFGTTWNNPISAQISHYIQGNMQSQALNNAIAGQMAFQSSLGNTGRGSKAVRKPRPATGKPVPPAPRPTTKTSPATAPAPTSPAGELTFQAVPARVLPAKLAAKYGKSPEDQKRLEGLIHQVINQWETQALTRQGLGKFSELWDLGKTVPYAVAVVHGVWRGNGAPPSREMIAASQRTLGERLRRSPDLAKLTDLQKQELYETQALMTFLLESGREAASRSHDLQAERKIQAMAGQFLTAMTGTQPDRIEISNDGFELKK